MKHVCFIFALFIHIFSSSLACAGDSDTEIAYGKIIYRQGILPDGKPLQATGVGGARLNGRQVTCYNCHRRSGLGTSEGSNQVPPITGDILFNERTKNYRELRQIRLTDAGARPAYDRNTLKRAITDGIDVTGRALDPLMPRFRLSERDIDYLVAYLNTLDSTSAPGVYEEEIHLATVFTPDTPDSVKTTALQIMRQYFHDYNNQTRNEKKRAENAPWHKAWQYGAYRDIQLHSWELTGPVEQWGKQLADYYAKTPVYALLNGIGLDTWQPVHEFCEQNEVPCLFPTTDYPGKSISNYYTVYFTNGLRTEAQALATHLAGQATSDMRVLQIYNNERKSANISAYLTSLLQKQNITVQAVAAGNVQALRTRLDSGPATDFDAVVIWATTEELNALEATHQLSRVAKRLFISDSYIPDPRGNLSEAVLENAYSLSRFVPAEKKAMQLRRVALWAKINKIQITDERVAANAYFSAITIAEAIKHMRANLSRDYLIERVEHMLERTVFNSVYPELRLGPGQRFASKGCYISGPLSAQGNSRDISRTQQWIVPDAGS